MVPDLALIQAKTLLYPPFRLVVLPLVGQALAAVADVSIASTDPPEGDEVARNATKSTPKKGTGRYSRWSPRDCKPDQLDL